MNNKKDKTIYWTINTDMTKKLSLKGLELLLFALINNFTQDEEGEFYGRISWLSKTLDVSRQAVSTALGKLLDKQLIKKVERENLTHFRINKKIIDHEIKQYNKRILNRECQVSLHGGKNDLLDNKKYLNEDEDTLCNEEKGLDNAGEELPDDVEKTERMYKDGLNDHVKKLDIGCKETLLSSYI